MSARLLLSFSWFLLLFSPGTALGEELGPKVLLNALKGDINSPFVDLTGDSLVDYQDLFVLGVVWKSGFPQLKSSSPADNEDGVAITRETILRFNCSLDPSTVNENSIHAEFGGEVLQVRLHVSSDRKTVTLFYEPDDLPPSAKVRVTVDGDQLKSSHGISVDVDRDGRVGGRAEIDFNTLSLTVVPGTSVLGRVFASELAPGGSGSVNIPLEGVTITVDGRENTLFTTTDNLGNFVLDPCPAGRFFVHIDGRTAMADLPEGAYYPFVGKAWESVIGQSTSVGNIYLPLISPNTLQPVSATEETIITIPEEVLDEYPDYPDLAGMVLTVPPDSLFADDGTRGGMVGIAPVPSDRIPGQLPPGLDLPIVITVQTDGATNFDQPVPVCFPNLEGLAPGEQTALWSFNHDTGRFEVVGSMTVSPDGETVCTDEGVGILAPGWHGARRGSPGGGGEGPEGPGPNNCKRGDSGNPCPPEQCCPEEEGGGAKGDPVYLSTGEFVHEETDLTIKGRGMDFIWKRRYASIEGEKTAMGHNWDFNYNISIKPEGRMLTLRHGRSQKDSFQRNARGSYVKNDFLLSVDEMPDATDEFEITFPNQGGWSFYPCDGSLQGGKIQAITDRNGNTIDFEYNDRGQLMTITDTLERVITIEHNEDGFIETVTDFIGRQVRYEYYSNNESGGSFGDLKSVTSPSVTGTPNGNDFPDGKTTSYTYTTGFPDEKLNHNLTTITDGRRNDPNDPTFGQGPYLVNEYSTALNPNWVTYDKVLRQRWGHEDDILDFQYVELDPENLGEDAVLRTIVNDRNGNVSEYDFDQGTHLLREVIYTGKADPDLSTTQSENRPTGKTRPENPDFFETRYEYNQDSLLKRTIHPNGNITENVYESDLNPAADSRFRGNLLQVKRLPGTHTPAGDQTEIVEEFEYDSDFGCSLCGTGTNFVTRHVDARGNETLRDYDERGNLRRIQDRIPSVVETFDYNQFGQMTLHILPDNGSGHRRQDQYTYYDSGHQRGYLHEEIVDATGFALTSTYEYDQVGNVTKRTDPRGNDSLFVHNQLDQLVRSISREVTPGTGLRYTRDYHFDGNNNLIQIDIENIGATGTLVAANPVLSTHREYEILNFKVRESREVSSDHSIVTESEYDPNRNLILTRLGEATNGNQPDNTVSYAYDERDLLYQQTRAPESSHRSTTQFDYDKNRNLVRISEGVEEVPQITQIVFDGYDRSVEETDPMGNVLVYHYDANSNATSEITFGELDDVEEGGANVRLAEVSYTYDPLDRMVRTDRAFFNTESQTPLFDGFSTTITNYNDLSQVTGVINDNSHEIRTTYDTVNRILTVIDDKQNTVTREYDRNDNLQEITEVDKSDLGNPDQVFTTTFEYDGLDRRSATIDNIGNRSESYYDSRSNQAVTLDALGNRVDYVYDGIDRLVSTVRYLTEDGTGATGVIDTIITGQTWDDSSRLVGQTDDNGNTTTYVFDALNRQFETVYADGTKHNSVLDIHDNKVQMTDANGSVVTCQYDLLDRVTQKDIAPGASSGVSDDTTQEMYIYDGLSRIVSAEDDDSLVERSYDSLSRVIEEIQNGQMVSSVYDGVGNHVECVYPSGRVIQTTYDELERKKQIADQGEAGFIAEYSYVGRDRVEEKRLGNGTRTEYAYDGMAGFSNPQGDFGVKSIIATKHTRESDGAVIDHRTYTWDPVGNKTRRNDIREGGQQVATRFQYDSVYRLIESGRSPMGGATETIQYTLDGVGNRLNVTGGDNPGTYTLDDTISASADRQMNQYTTTPQGPQVYDENGNWTARNPDQPSEENLEYDYQSRMVGYENANTGITATYAYDVFGRRISKEVMDATGTNATDFFYSDWQVCEEQHSEELDPVTFVYGNYIDEPLALESGIDSEFYHADDLFNVSALTDQTGNIISRYDYDDFGTLKGDESSSLGNSYQFTGRRFDHESSLYYYRFRYQQPSHGRFTSVDPLGPWGDLTSAGNGLSYVGNNPWTLSDPSGLKTWRGWCAINTFGYIAYYARIDCSLQTDCEECDCEEECIKETVDVSATLGGAADNPIEILNIPLSTVIYDTTFEGAESAQEFGGVAKYDSISLVIPFGVSWGNLQLGSAFSHGFSLGIGFDVGAITSTGISTVRSARKKPCK